MKGASGVTEGPGEVLKDAPSRDGVPLLGMVEPVGA